MSARYITIAAGSFQGLEDVSGFADLAVSVDDFCPLERPPGKTLIVGGSALALEYAGILTSLGFSTTLLIRNVMLKGCDQDMVAKVEAMLEKHGVRFVKKMLLADLHRDAVSGRIKARMQAIKAGAGLEDDFDTVIVANNRTGDTASLKLVNAGIKSAAGGRLRVNDSDQTTVPHIFAIGDVAVGRPESTPATARTGQLLARRLFSSSKEKMQFEAFPMVVLTPIEYGYCGCTEEDLVKKQGNQNVEVYHTSFKPLEWELLESREDTLCYTKLITTKNDGVIRGIHYLGPNAAEIVQGYSVAIAVGATKEGWDKALGIHPTCAEVLIGMKYTRSAFPSAKKTGC